MRLHSLKHKAKSSPPGHSLQPPEKSIISRDNLLSCMTFKVWIPGGKIKCNRVFLLLILRDAAINFFLSVLMYFMDAVIVMVIKDDFKVKMKTAWLQTSEEDFSTRVRESKWNTELSRDCCYSPEIFSFPFHLFFFFT